MKTGDIQIESLVVMSRSMLEKAQADCWDEVIALEEERRLLLKLYFSDEIELADDVEMIQAAIQTIQSLDDQLMVVGQQKKRYLTGVIQGFDVGKKAIKAYSNP